MSEKQLLKWMLIRVAFLIGLYLLVTTIMGFAFDHRLDERLMRLSDAKIYDEAFDLENYECEMDREDLIRISSLRVERGAIFLTVEPIKAGDDITFINLTNKETGVILTSAAIQSTKRGLLINKNTSDFSHYRERQFCIVVLMICLSVLLWIGFIKSCKEVKFSYQSIFFVGLAIWMSVITLIITLNFLTKSNMMNLYIRLETAASQFATFTFPLVFIFAIALSISNISLIRHEGFRLVNALGIVISFMMIFGFVVLAALTYPFSNGSELISDIWDAFLELLDTMYVLLECFLIGAIICGLRAAHNKPAYDKDYIVILGCKIKKDGTLYPLIRGRVDRAIAFYQDQLVATGKKAIFIPSGGQGADEVISEGEAMKRYLLEQGIEESQIIAETASKNTIQNMKFSYALMEEGKKAVFSTTNYHVFRSGTIARKAGIDIDGIGSATAWYFWPNAYVREVIGMLSYKWRALVILLIPIVTFFTVVRFAMG